ncbi:pilus assembly PilX N-terminal domain-containing protein [uncultured Thalassolituus sp.]|uniref:pilus assembly PilX family protein n=1 Tax=uncultured Thalassolituus sp. TaxID=285273 RepID=UPI002630D09A|nr:pilus assembly PilX N-terminal domain-containing protein [uncultured Thalassolituus sp.]
MNYSANKGAALIVSLIMLTAVTFLAVISLQNSSTQVKMVGNTQTRESVFQAGMSALETLVSDFSAEKDGTTILSDAMTNTVQVNGEAVINQDTLNPMFDKATPGKRYSYNDQALKPVSVSVSYQGPGGSLNFSLSGDSSVQKFNKHPFLAEAGAEDRSERFASDQNLGFTFMSTTGR